MLGGAQLQGTSQTAPADVGGLAPGGGEAGALKGGLQHVATERHAVNNALGDLHSLRAQQAGSAGSAWNIQARGAFPAQPSAACTAAG